MNRLPLISLILIILTGGCMFKQTKNESNIEIVDSGWSYIVSDSGKFVSYGLEIKNYSDSILKTPIIKIVGYNKDNGIVFESSESLSYIYALDTIYFGKTFKIDDEISTLDISLEIDSNNYTNIENENYIKTSALEISNITEINKNAYKEYKGTIINNGAIDIIKPIISIIYKKDNKIVGGSYSYINSLNMNEIEEFNVYTTNFPEYDSFYVNVLVSND